jgi:hypothetical protein
MELRMPGKNFLRLLLAAGIAAGLLACGAGGSDPAAASRYTADLQVVSDGIAAAAGYSGDAVELTSSRVRLRIEIRDPQLAGADPATRNTVAANIVTDAEKVLAVHPEFASLQQISVAVIHAAAKSGAGSDWHIEDVIEFRKGPNQRFSVHIT